MTVSTSRLAFEDCYAVMQAALDDKAGVMMRMASENAATHFRLRCHQARKIDRQFNAETYEKGNPMHGCSAYDRLTIKIRQDETGIILVFEQTNLIPGDVISLTDGEAVPIDMPMLPPPLKMLEAPREAPTDAELAADLAGMDVVDGEVLPPEASPKPAGIRRV